MSWVPRVTSDAVVVLPVSTFSHVCLSQMAVGTNGNDPQSHYISAKLLPFDYDTKTVLQTSEHARSVFVNDAEALARESPRVEAWLAETLQVLSLLEQRLRLSRQIPTLQPGSPERVVAQAALDAAEAELGILRIE